MKILRSHPVKYTSTNPQLTSRAYLDYTLPMDYDPDVGIVIKTMGGLNFDDATTPTDYEGFVGFSTFNIDDDFLRNATFSVSGESLAAGQQQLFFSGQSTHTWEDPGFIHIHQSTLDGDNLGGINIVDGAPYADAGEGYWTGLGGKKMNLNNYDAVGSDVASGTVTLAGGDKVTLIIDLYAASFDSAHNTRTVYYGVTHISINGVLVDLDDLYVGFGPGDSPHCNPVRDIPHARPTVTDMRVQDAYLQDVPDEREWAIKITGARVILKTAGPTGLRIDDPEVVPSRNVWKAAGTLTAFKAVAYATDGTVDYPDRTTQVDKPHVLGITKAAYVVDDPVAVWASGEVAVNGAWTWTPGDEVYIGTAGALTQTPPVSGWIYIIGIASSATQILLT